MGTGGWAYFSVPNMNPLVAYSRAFDFVEVNSTFYEIPSKVLVRSWRKRVPPGFEFSVRAHRSLTHKYMLESVKEASEILGRMVEICGILEAEVLHLQTPPSMDITRSKIKRIRNLFTSVNLRGVHIALEVRSDIVDPQLLRLMRDLDIIHCVDLSRQTPNVPSEILYSRLFGKGFHNVYQFTDEELKEIDAKTEERGSKKTYLSFHGVKMYKDAARFKVFKESKKFPQVTGSLGLNSLKEVLAEDTKFPCSKEELIRSQGWKLIDITAEERVRASHLLERLSDKKYSDIQEVLHSLRSL